MRYAADLHIHSCLSPCGDLSMSPALIARRAASLGIALAGLTDHNSAMNAPAFAVACAREGVRPVFGVEVTTLEEVHVLALFETPEQALEFGKFLYERLPPVMNDPARLGDQVYVNDREEILGEVDKYLVNAVDLSLDETAAAVADREGLFIPAHIDRPVFSLSSQLGFIPEMPYSALEITERPCLMNTGAYPLVANSDAHYPEAVGGRVTRFEGASPDFRTFREALLSGKTRCVFTRG